MNSWIAFGKYFNLLLLKSHTICKKSELKGLRKMDNFNNDPQKADLLYKKKKKKTNITKSNRILLATNLIYLLI